jgi:hypothetical protein
MQSEDGRLSVEGTNRWMMTHLLTHHLETQILPIHTRTHTHAIIKIYMQ